MSSPCFWCRRPTWTWQFIFAISLNAALVASGCNFADYSKTSGVADGGTSTLAPACSESGAISADAAAPPGLIAHWTFDDALSSTPQWVDSQSQRKLILEPNPTNYKPAVTRLNGQGQAINLDGKSWAAYDAANDDTLFPTDISEGGGFTASAWISIRLDDWNANSAGDAGPLRVWPIISTLGLGSSQHCGGYQLDLRADANTNRLALAFSYQYVPPSDAGTCGTNQLEIPLTTPSWSWGIGRWHHVAATYTNLESKQASLALYWDGSRLATDTPVSSTFDGSITYEDHVFYVGSNLSMSTLKSARSRIIQAISTKSRFSVETWLIARYPTSISPRPRCRDRAIAAGPPRKNGTSTLEVTLPGRQSHHRQPQRCISAISTGARVFSRLVCSRKSTCGVMTRRTSRPTFPWIRPGMPDLLTSSSPAETTPATGC